MKFVKKNEEVKNILGLGRSDKENYNNSDFYSQLQKNGLTYTYFINQTPKRTSHMPRIAQLLHAM